MLDIAIEYELDKVTGVDDYLERLDTDESNIVTSNETEAESKVCDADIAKSFVDFTKSNMFAKAVERMLAQAN